MIARLRQWWWRVSLRWELASVKRERARLMRQRRVR